MTESPVGTCMVWPVISAGENMSRARPLPQSVFTTPTTIMAGT